MAYFTERYRMRKPIERTSTITIEMYALLFNCCERYYDNIAWRFPDQCSDGNGICGVDMEKFNNELLFEIQSLYRDHNEKVARPNKRECSRNYEDFHQYALLDLIELIASNVRDISSRSWHDFFKHYDLRFVETNNDFQKFRNEINNIFTKTGLLYTLTDKKIVERVIENGVLSTEIEAVTNSIKEHGTKELLDDAINFFKKPNPTERRIAVEKMWDALERLKTYYTTLDKKASAEKIVNDMANDQAEFVKLFNDEFRALTEMGNRFRIRHHETNKIDIIDIRHYDYFFNRCLSLISSAVQYLQ